MCFCLFFQQMPRHLSEKDHGRLNHLLVERFFKIKQAQNRRSAWKVFRVSAFPLSNGISGYILFVDDSGKIYAVCIRIIVGSFDQRCLPSLLPRQTVFLF